ncbi:MAG TPA: hypothetical protein V6D22_11325 [Candidatus Obscuribacterales bacterium]
MRYAFIILAICLTMQQPSAGQGNNRSQAHAEGLPKIDIDPSSAAVASPTVEPKVNIQQGALQPALVSESGPYCCGKALFGSHQKIDAFLNGKVDTLCGWDPVYQPRDAYGDVYGDDGAARPLMPLFSAPVQPIGRSKGTVWPELQLPRTAPATSPQ